MESQNWNAIGSANDLFPVWTKAITWTNHHVFPDSKVHGAKMGPIWCRQDPGGPHVGPMNLAIWVVNWTHRNKLHWYFDKKCLLKKIHLKKLICNISSFLLKLKFALIFKVSAIRGTWDLIIKLFEHEWPMFPVITVWAQIKWNSNTICLWGSSSGKG